MGKRYYCDYCDRSFVDDYEARKKHISGSMHVRLRKEHYDVFRDAKTILAEESAKVPCKRYQQTRECVFGTNCRFSHYTAEDLMNLKMKVEGEEERLEREKYTRLDLDHDDGPTLTSWLQKRSKMKTSKSTVEEHKPKATVLWELPPELQEVPDLPPSLQPLRVEDFTNAEFETWG
ncbi:zinc finger matrin-type protein 5 [Schistocerca americana]|uniref:zinc finger matrin-type protein 5 n=1 Tax=Schistocerca americana TaxID=7009 RepID=UPI001F4FC8EF|nr:zinc finger matrin-type protein 5 [Schistocerca americana]